jgi:hypothetical protein
MLEQFRRLHVNLVGGTPLDANALVALGIEAMRSPIRGKQPPRLSTWLSQTFAAIDKVGRIAPRAPSPSEDTSQGGAHKVTRPSTEKQCWCGLPSGARLREPQRPPH